MSITILKPLQQISNDYLLGIVKQPDVTCPLIDDLIFIGDDATKHYSVDIDYDPSHLKVDTTELIHSTNQLTSWATGVLGCFSLLKSATIDSIYTHSHNKVYIDSKKETVINLLYINRINDVYSYQSKINRLIDDWKENHDKRNLCLKDIMKNKDYIKKIDKHFEKEIKPQFERLSFQFTQLLESIRDNNNSIRESAYQIRSVITQSPYVTEYDLRQPMQYLIDQIKQPNTIALGIIDNPYDSNNYLKLAFYLVENKCINDEQYKYLLKKDGELDKPVNEHKKDKIEALLTSLKTNGYKHILYYESYNDFMKEKDKFINLSFSKKNKLTR